MRQKVQMEKHNQFVCYLKRKKKSFKCQPKSREEKKALLYNNQFQKRRHKQLTKVKIRGVTALELSLAKQFATGV
jgi:hypothetical protein